MKRAYVFPGQGSQAVGMGVELAKAFPIARQTFEEVDDALSDHLFTLISEGPEDKLTLTQNAQPALMAVSLAAWRVMVDGGVDPSTAAVYAGHSLGEYSALAASGTLNVADTARLLRLRGEAMQAAVPVGEGAMAALLGLDLKAANDVAHEAQEAAGSGQVCVMANDNAPGQVVLSGHTAAIDIAIDIAKTYGAKRAMKLTVSAPFHSPLMAPAAHTMESALANTSMSSPAAAIICNVTSATERDPNQLRRNLVTQITGSVRWRETIMQMAEHGIEEIVEVGSGKVLTGLAKRTAREIATRNVATPEDIEAMFAG